MERVTEGDPERVVLETNVRLSRSALWDAQRRYFDSQGVAAWRTNTVPHYVTNNPALARAHAQVVLGLLADRARSGEPGPLHVLELGAGTGRFAFLFLTALEALRRGSALERAPLRYVATDFTDANLRFMRSHPRLAPFFESGLLDLARFDVEKDRELTLELAAKKLAAGALADPLVVIANYVFDGVSQDIFHVRDGRLEEGLVSTAADSALDFASPDPLGALRFTYEVRPAPEIVYEERELERVLRHQASERSGTFLFPGSALRAIGRLAALANGRLCLIVADWNDHEERPAREPGDPGMAVHGSISLPVNFDALSDFVLAAGGLALRVEQQHRSIELATFVLGIAPEGLEATRTAFARFVARNAPDDLASLRRTVSFEALDLAQTLAALRLWQDDPKVLLDALPALASHADGASPLRRAEIVETIERAWQNFYPIGEKPDLAREAAALLYRLGAFARAAELLRASLAFGGETAAGHFNLGLCSLSEGDAPRAAECFRQALALDPRFVPWSAFQKE